MALTPNTLTRALSVRITEAQAQRLAAEADRRGVRPNEALRQVLDALPPPPDGAPPARRRPPQASAYHPG